MVQQGIEVARWMQEALARPDCELQVYMENPVSGRLWRRPYMRDWEFEKKVVKKFAVHYCACMHTTMCTTSRLTSGQR